MNELLEQIIRQGLSAEQAESAIQAVNEWLKKEYPSHFLLFEAYIHRAMKENIPVRLP